MFNPASFNPFADVTHMSDAQVKRLSQADDVDSKSRLHRLAVQQAPRPAANPMVEWLQQAGARWLKRHDQFADGKADACFDLSDKLKHFGTFASERQESFARKLIEWSLPRGAALPWQTAQEPAQAPIAAPAAPTPAPAPAVVLPRLFDLMQRLSKLTLQGVILARKNQDSLVWVKLPGIDGVVGRITDGGVLTIFTGRLRNTLAPEVLTALLLAIEVDPEAAAVLHGKASGRCSVCSRDLTDPASIERGIGPICAEKFQF